MQPKIDIIVTRHAPLLRYLRELGLADDHTLVMEHVSISDIKGKHVAGVLPVSMAAHAASYTEVPMALTPADRTAIQAGDLSYERMVEIASPPVTYHVTSLGQRRSPQTLGEAMDAFALPGQPGPDRLLKHEGKEHGLGVIVTRRDGADVWERWIDGRLAETRETFSVWFARWWPRWQQHTGRTEAISPDERKAFAEAFAAGRAGYDPAPLPKATTYSVVFVGDMLGTGIYAGPGLGLPEARQAWRDGGRIHGSGRLSIEPDSQETTTP